ncbi:MAG TPA: ABC transporter substrate-binding protein [Candidatus Nitrosocosmicus sp.]|jgi:peptide/nickel transport system substrate-binding protein|nr:ABC transporter substrate-binding protein [Candidatus Nitrosocosmicus sp.]
MLASVVIRRALIALAVVLVTGAAGDALAQVKGGVMRVGNLGEPPSLDAHWTTASITETLTNHIYEGLYSLDKDKKPIPMLADSHTVSRDGLVYTFKLRQGIKFHNGKEMTSEDVVPSLARWGKQSIYGKSLFAQVDTWKAIDKYTVEMKLKEKSAIVLISLAVPNNFGAIYPKEIAEKFEPAVKATEYIGTGPYKLAEWKPDQYIRMVRFDEYKSRAEKPTGYGGGKTAYVDEIRWVPVPEVATRVAQMETGELDFADDLNLDAFDRLKKNAAVRPIVSKPYYWLVAVFNKKEGLMTNQKLRQAWQAAIDIEPIMKTVAGGKAEFYRMDNSLTPVEITAWHTNLTGLPWNERNKDKAKRLLQEAGYKKEPIRFMTTQEYKWMYDFALLTKQQLEDVGFNIDLQVVDWATLVKRRNNSKEYDAFTTGMGAFYDPTHHIYLTSSWPGWNTDEDILTLQSELARETDPKKRMALWEKQTRQFYEKVPVIRYGDLFGLRAARKAVKGFDESNERIRFYNVWLEK